MSTEDIKTAIEAAIAPLRDDIRKLREGQLPADHLFTIDELSGYIGRAIPTIRGYYSRTAKTKGPKRLGKSRWRKSDVDRWLVDRGMDPLDKAMLKRS